MNLQKHNKKTKKEEKKIKTQRTQLDEKHIKSFSKCNLTHVDFGFSCEWYTEKNV